MTIKELDDSLRKAASDNVIVAHAFMQHRQFTTEALYQIAIGLHEENQRLHAIAVDALNRSAAAPILAFELTKKQQVLVDQAHYQKLCGGQSNTIEGADPDPWEARCAAAMPIVEAAINLCHLAFDLTKKQQVLVDQAHYQKLQAAVGQYRIEAERERRANLT